MGDNKDMELFLKNVPVFTVFHKALLTYLYHFTIFLLIMFSLLWVTSKFLLVAIPAQFLVASVSTVPFIYIAKNFDKLREKYIKKYSKYPWQHFWYNYSYTSPFGAAAFYFPLFFMSYDFIPSIFDLPPYFITTYQFPFYSSIPLGIFVIIIGLMLVRPSQDHDRDMDVYISMMKPENSGIITDGIYRYIRHPRFLSRLIIAIGFGIFANNLFAILLAITHFLPYYALIRAEDKELIRRYKDEAAIYQKKVPALFPKIGNWWKFFRFIFIGEKN